MMLVRAAEVDDDVLSRPYLLVTNIPCFLDQHGDVYLDQAWHHDLEGHLAYLPRLKIACPTLALEAGDVPGLVRASGYEHRFIHLKPHASTWAAALALPQTALAIHRAVRAAEIVHSGVAGWPYPLGWLATASARLQRRKLLIIVESAPWRTTSAHPGEPGWVKRVRNLVYEALAGWSCRQADIALFTQPSYLESLHRHGRGLAYVTPASWILDEHVLSAQCAKQAWEPKQHQPPRFLFAGRLTAEKGVEVLLAALSLLERQGLSLNLDFVGEGPCAGAIDQAARTLRTVRIRRLPPQPYGVPFFALLDRYHALVVPSLSDEQPRIVFDGAARALGAIAAQTDGLRPHVADGVSGRLVPPGNPDQLAAALAEAHRQPEVLRQWGLSALERARPQTHTAMHARRADILRSALSTTGRAQTAPQRVDARAPTAN